MALTELGFRRLLLSAYTDAWASRCHDTVRSSNIPASKARGSIYSGNNDLFQKSLHSYPPFALRGITVHAFPREVSRRYQELGIRELSFLYGVQLGPDVQAVQVELPCLNGPQMLSNLSVH